MNNLGTGIYNNNQNNQNNININSNSSTNFNKQNIPLSIQETSKSEYDLLKCEFCDEHIKRRFLELKEIFYKIYKNFIKVIKLIKIKDEISLKKIIDETGVAQKEFLKYKCFVEKLIILKKNSNWTIPNKYILFENLEEKEKRDLFEELATRKELLKRFRRNVIELEEISKVLQTEIETVSLTNSLINISTIN